MGDEEPIDYTHIRNVASKNWLKPASVSLAKLDQVKNRVYNMGFTDPKTLQTTGNRPEGGTTMCQVEGSTQPPQCKVTLQKSAWGSDVSIPTLIRQQNERQKMRPASAKLAKPTRPQSGKKKRPQSAKEANSNGYNTPGSKPIGGMQVAWTRSQSAMYVRGAHYDPSHRPPEGIGHHTGTGWSAPQVNNETPRREIENTIQQFLDGQLEMNFLRDGAKDDYIPPAPRSSPDFMRMVQSQLDSGPQEAGMDDTVSVNPGSNTKPHLLRKPISGPIKVSVPQADVDDAVEYSVDFDSDSEPVLRQTKTSSKQGAKSHGHAAPKSLNNSFLRTLVQDEQEESTESRPTELVHMSGDVNTHTDICVDIEYEQTVGTIGDVPNKVLNVTFDEDQNVTVDITPRDGASGPKVVIKPNRPYSGRRDLRHVKSRTDSGFSGVVGPKPDFPKVHDRQAKGLESSTEREIPYSQNELPNRVRNMISNRQKAKVGKINKITVNYEDMADDEPKEARDSSKERKKNKKLVSKSKSDIETQMSKCTISDDESHGQAGRPDFRSRSPFFDIGQIQTAEDPENQRPPASSWAPTKSVSGSVKNYYELALKPKATEVSEPEKTEDKITKSLVKTVKTIELGDGCVNETKSVSVVDAHIYNTKREYISPKPARPHSAKIAQKDDKPTVIPGRAWQADGDERSESPSVCPTDVTRGDEVENRPPSRQKRRRVVSAGVVRTHDPVGHKIADVIKYRHPKASCPRDHSHTNSHTNLHTKSSSSMQSAAASKPAKQPARRPHTSYGLSSSKSKKDQPEPPQQVIEIWTRKEEFEVETEGVKECKEIQSRLLDAGVPVTLETLKRGLLPPTEYGFSGPTYKTTVHPNTPPNFAGSGLISKPSMWLADEYRKVKEAQKKVREATQIMLEQEKEDRRKALAEEYGISLKKKKPAKKKRAKSAH